MTAVSPLHPEAGRDSWFPISQIQGLRERVESLEFEREQREHEAALAAEALHMTLMVTNQLAARVRKLEERQ